ncbi:MAG: sigma-54 dependent transcriptional regulator [Brumimicrobium sp.]|nr:sigma-54 dependent transcriptional regulator [Brumimicrobium sp.]
MKKVLVIDDDVDICTLLKRFLERKGFSVDTAFKGKEGIEMAIENDYNVVLTDFRLPDLDGVKVLQSLKSEKPGLPVIVITGYSDVNQAVKLIRMGAYEYVTKPIFPEEIILLVEEALNKKNHSEKVEKPEEEAGTPTSRTALKKNDSFIYGKSPGARNIRKLIELVAPTDMTVVILGESGTGKEVAARMIHESSKRAKKPFIAVDCGALPKELAANELFGHEKGAYTGAISNKKGHFEMAEGGTLFLDEIGNLSYENQVKLLRVLQERKIRRMGGEKDISVDVRIIVATNEDLKNAMDRGDFREDIYYRINEFNIELPALKDSKEDLEEYVNFFLNKSNIELNKQIQKVDKTVLEAFDRYSWPGNIRELKNVMKRLVLLTTGETIGPEVLPAEILHPVSFADNEEETSSFDLKTVVENAESRAIKRALKASNYNKSKCAQLLGVDRKTLYNKMNAYGLN